MPKSKEDAYNYLIGNRAELTNNGVPFATGISLPAASIWVPLQVFCTHTDSLECH